jgi:predicted MPP superfamily phosphohydrolase
LQAKAHPVSTAPARRQVFWRLAEQIQLLLYRGACATRLSRRLGLASQLHVVELAVSPLNGARNFPPLTVAFASDFHAGPTTDPEILRRACDALRAVRPDLLLLGGDFVSLDVQQIDWLAPLLGSIDAPMGRFAVLGNHDLWYGAERIVRALEAAGIEMLINKNRRLAPPFQDIWLCGLDEFTMGMPDARSALRGADGARIVLMHAPANLLNLQGERFDVAFCGHTHGGQIAWRGGIPIKGAPGPLSRAYNRGQFRMDHGGTLVVSVGLGCSTVPVRINAAPEIICCRFGPTGQAQPAIVEKRDD